MSWFEDVTLFRDNSPLPDGLHGDHLSLARIYPDIGKVQPGWGAKEFMENYLAGAFQPKRALHWFNKYGSPFGIIMRSVPLVCVDIDGKNGGIETSRLLDLSVTLAERSKSGSGFHLFYKVPNSKWDEKLGYAEFPDLIGLIPGVDIKGLGIVYHYSTQVWNRQKIAVLPPKLSALIGQAQASRMERRVSESKVADMDDMELVMLHDELRKSLEKPVPSGRRNQTLFAIGAKLMAAKYPVWDQALHARATELGLSSEEADQIITNVERYT